eukprot:Anaeramoba_flamelloidesa828681_17.p1 GENE.a828681_17~~a828681_17.p1  ORF type:complete len:207 (-),score=62.41 a828681_17:32-628(-)
MSDIEEDECKVVLLGDTGVGKSCLVLQFCYGKFEDNIDSTIGASYITKQINVSNQILKLQIWDTAGQERYQSLAPMYYRGSEIAIVIFDITSQDSFIKAKQWILEVAGKEMPNLIIGMVGNKIDLEKERVVSSDMAEEYCSLNKIHYFETSAKTAENVQEMFFGLALELLKIPKSKRTKKKEKNNNKEKRVKRKKKQK